MAFLNLGDYKKTLMRDIWKNKNIVMAIDSKHDKYDPSDPSSLVYKNIFPFLRVPSTIEDTSTYVLLDVGSPNPNSRNNFFCEMKIVVWVLSHQEKMEMKGVSSTRIDYIADEIEEMFVGNPKYGYGLLQLVSDMPYIYNEKFLYRELIFKTLDAKTSPARSPVHP